jgi:hypothetical protein
MHIFVPLGIMLLLAGFGSAMSGVIAREPAMTRLGAILGIGFLIAALASFALAWLSGGL